MSEPKTGYSVLIEQPDGLQAPAIANVLSAWRKMPFQDAIRIAKNCWGVVMEGLEETPAQHLAGQLGAGGIKSFVMQSRNLAELPTLGPKTLKKAAAEAGGLVLFPEPDDPGIHAYKDPNAPEGPVTVPWAQVTLVAAAGVNVTEYSKIKVKEGPDAAERAVNIGIMMATGLPIKIGKKERVVEKTVESTDLVFFVDVLFKDPDRRLRIDAQNFDFSVLKERKVYNVLGNLKTWLADLAKAAPGACQNRGTRILLANKPIRDMGYNTLEDLDKESRWLLTLVRRATP